MTEQRCGIVLAGGNGTRLAPLTKVVSKQLLPVYDKPMIYYPLSTLMRAGIKDILIIAKPEDVPLFSRLLGDGSEWGISLSYAKQERPEGIAQAFLIAESFINQRGSALILGDNLFYGPLEHCFTQAKERLTGATIFGYKVKDPKRYGVIQFDSEKRVKQILEKPRFAPSNYAVTGLYFYDNTACDRVKTISKSARGEYEITDLNNLYCQDNELCVELLEDGHVWLDTGTYDSLHEASSFVQAMQHRQRTPVGCPYFVATQKGWLSTP